MVINSVVTVIFTANFVAPYQACQNLVRLVVCDRKLFSFILINTHTILLTQNNHKQSLMLYSANGFQHDTLGTYGLLAGIINAGLNFGTAIAPAVSGTVTQYLGYEFTTVIASGLYTAMVSFIQFFLPK